MPILNVFELQIFLSWIDRLEFPKPKKKKPKKKKTPIFKDKKSDTASYQATCQYKMLPSYPWLKMSNLGTNLGFVQISPFSQSCLEYFIFA